MVSGFFPASGLYNCSVIWTSGHYNIGGSRNLASKVTSRFESEVGVDSFSSNTSSAWDGSLSVLAQVDFFLPHRQHLSGLTDTVMPKEAAHVPLLGYGDPRNILFTIHSQRYDSESTTVYC